MKHFYCVTILILMTGNVWAIYPNQSLAILDLKQNIYSQNVEASKINTLSSQSRALYQRIDAEISTLQNSIYELIKDPSIEQATIVDGLTGIISTLRNQQQQLLDFGYVQEATKSQLLDQFINIIGITNGSYDFLVGPDRPIMGGFKCILAPCSATTLAPPAELRTGELALLNNQIRVLLFDGSVLADNMTSQMLPMLQPVKDDLISQLSNRRLSVSSSANMSCSRTDFCVTDTNFNVLQELGITAQQLTVAQLPVVNSTTPTDAQYTYDLVRQALLVEAGRSDLSAEELHGLTKAINDLAVLSTNINQPESGSFLGGLSKLGRRLVNLVTNFSFADPKDPSHILTNLIQQLPPTIKSGVEVHMQFVSLKSYANVVPTSATASAKQAFNTTLTTIQNEIIMDPDKINIQTESNLLTAADVINKLDITSMTIHSPGYLTQLVTVTRNLLNNINTYQDSTDSDGRVLGYLETGVNALMNNNVAAVNTDIYHIASEQPSLFAADKPDSAPHHDTISSTVIFNPGIFNHDILNNGHNYFQNPYRPHEHSIPTNILPIPGDYEDIHQYLDEGT